MVAVPMISTVLLGCKTPFEELKRRLIFSVARTPQDSNKKPAGPFLVVRYTRQERRLELTFAVWCLRTLVCTAVSVFDLEWNWTSRFLMLKTSCFCRLAHLMSRYSGWVCFHYVAVLDFAVAGIVGWRVRL